MKLEATSIPDVKVIRLDVYPDQRGAFFEAFDEKKVAALGITDTFVMDAVSRNFKKGTIRGMHYQAAPHAQAKLVRASKGRLLDVAVDMRVGSPDFGQHVAFELRADEPAWLYIPVGFAHGFCTLEDDVEVSYKLADHYAPQSAGGFLWSDPELGIGWPMNDKALASDKDMALPLFSELGTVFTYEGEKGV